MASDRAPRPVRRSGEPIQVKGRAHRQGLVVRPAIAQVKIEVHRTFQRTGMHEVLQVGKELRKGRAFTVPSMTYKERSVSIVKPPSITPPCAMRNPRSKSMRALAGDARAHRVQVAYTGGRVQQVAHIIDPAIAELDILQAEHGISGITARHGGILRSTKLQEVAEIEAFALLHDVDVR